MHFKVPNTWIISLYFHNSEKTMPIFKWEDESLQKLPNMPKVTELGIVLSWTNTIELQCLGSHWTTSHVSLQKKAEWFGFRLEQCFPGE